jgi:hypothetical protein
VGAHSAQLNGHGKANNGPAYSYFEYWKTADPANKLKTGTRNWPAGAEAPVWERPQHLSASAAYSYRLCGNDQGKDPLCVKHQAIQDGRRLLPPRLDGGTLRGSDDPGSIAIFLWVPLAAKLVVSPPSSRRPIAPIGPAALRSSATAAVWHIGRSAACLRRRSTRRRAAYGGCARW